VLTDSIGPSLHVIVSETFPLTALLMLLQTTSGMSPAFNIYGCNLIGWFFSLLNFWLLPAVALKRPPALSPRKFIDEVINDPLIVYVDLMLS